MRRLWRQLFSPGRRPRTRVTFVSADVQGCTSVAVSGRKERQKSPKPFCLAVFGPRPRTVRATSDFDCLGGSVDGTSDLHGWRKCKGLSGTILALCRRRTPGSLPGPLAGPRFGFTHPMYRKHKCRGRTEAQERPRLDRRGESTNHCTTLAFMILLPLYASRASRTSTTRSNP